MNLVSTVTNFAKSIIAGESPEALRDRARRAQLDARADYAEDPSDEKRAAMLAADEAYARADEHVRAHEALQARRRVQAAEKRLLAARIEYAEAKATARGLESTIAPHIEWFVETSREARKRHQAILDARQSQHEAVIKMGALARELGLPDEAPSPAHGGTIAALIGRAIGRNIKANGESVQRTASLATHELFQPDYS